MAVKIDQRRAEQSGRLDGGPEQAQVARGGHGGHRREEQQQAAGEDRLWRVVEDEAVLPLLAGVALLLRQVGRGVMRRAQEQQRGHAQEKEAWRVEREPLPGAGQPERRFFKALRHGIGPAPAAVGQYAAGRQQEMQPGGPQQQPAARGVVAQQEGGRAGEQGQDDEEYRHQPSSPRRQSESCDSASVSIWSNSRLMWKIAMPITNTATKTSSSIASSTISGCSTNSARPKI